MTRLTLLVGAACLIGPPARGDDAAKPTPAAALVAALQGDKPFLRNNYALVRAAYADYFAQTYREQIRVALPEDGKLLAWLAKNDEARETLYCAIDPDADSLGRCIQIFNELYQVDPEKFKDHVDLAVAIAVTWDDPSAPYDYAYHARRTKSEMPPEAAQVGAVENYKRLIALTGAPKQALDLLPWEFLVHVVNNRTPAAECEWAVKNYLPRRAGIGKSYSDIVYDTVMLKTQSEVCKLNDKPYTLESIKKYGGVCAMQADFAARVAKSLAVPAEYVRGEANNGTLHAWVMWVELKRVTPTRLDFALMSEGRYFGDQYYIGTIRDPKTGRDLTDRAMERRLTVLGASPQSGRQAELLMRAYPIVSEAKKYSPRDKEIYIRKVQNVFAADEKSWLALAELYETGELKDANEAFLAANRAVTTFASFPDFSWQLAGPLLTPIKDKPRRVRLYERLVQSYESLSRPDLACEARLALADYQAAEGDHKKAADGLAGTMRKFPSEGRYVPKMMQKLEEVCREYKGGTDLLAKFYLQFLPLIPARRGDEPSKYAIAMHEQAVTFFEANSKPREAALVKQRLALVRGSGR